jgi:SsrA-binding protein
MARAKSTGERLVTKNRRAHFDYELGQSYEAGLCLIGSEVRSLRDNGADLSDAWVEIDRGGEAWLRGMRIPQMKHAAFGHEEKRARKLLLRREQIDRLKGSIERDGMTLIATKCYFKDNFCKVEIALARGRKHYDKRQAIRARETDREARVAMARARK